MNHTPGPWKAAGYNWTTIIQEGSGARIAKINDGWPDGEQETNARLLASAPRLLAALELLVRVQGCTCGARVESPWIPHALGCEIAAAIAAARGEAT